MADNQERTNGWIAIALSNLPPAVVTNNESGVNISGTFSGAGRFATSATLTSSSNPRFVVAVDINGDGKVDLVCANAAANNLTFYTNNGAGGFLNTGSIGIGSSPQAVAAADVNGDGKMDLISVNQGVNSVNILTNNGSGGFLILSSVTVGAAPTAIAVADVNGDGKVDLIASSLASNVLCVLTNNGKGGFGLSATVPTGSGPRMVAVADVNGDGWPDLVNPNQNSNSIAVLLNQPGFAGSFNGGGAGLTGVPESGVANLVADLALRGTGSAGFSNAAVFVLTNDARNLSWTNPSNVVNGTFAGDGGGLTNLNAGNLTSGTIPLALLPSEVVTNPATGVFMSGAFEGDGSGLTILNANSLVLGQVALGLLPSAVVTNNASGVTLNGTFSGNGSGLTSLSLPPIVVTNNASGVTLSGSFSGNGSGLTTLNSNVALLNAASQTFTGTLAATKWKATTIINQIGPLPVGTSSNLFTSGGTLLISASGTGWSTGSGFKIGMNILLDGTLIDSSQIFLNIANNHVAFPSRTIVKTGVPAGWHAVTLVPSTVNMTTDSQDSYMVTVQELPF